MLAGPIDTLYRDIPGRCRALAVKSESARQLHGDRLLRAEAIIMGSDSRCGNPPSQATGALARTGRSGPASDPELPFARGRRLAGVGRRGGVVEVCRLLCGQDRSYRYTALPPAAPRSCVAQVGGGGGTAVATKRLYARLRLSGIWVNVPPVSQPRSSGSRAP